MNNERLWKPKQETTIDAIGESINVVESSLTEPKNLTKLEFLKQRATQAGRALLVLTTIVIIRAELARSGSPIDTTKAENLIEVLTTPHSETSPIIQKSSYPHKLYLPVLFIDKSELKPIVISQEISTRGDRGIFCIEPDREEFELARGGIVWEPLGIINIDSNSHDSCAEVSATLFTLRTIGSASGKENASEIILQIEDGDDSPSVVNLSQGIREWRANKRGEAIVKLKIFDFESDLARDLPDIMAVADSRLQVWNLNQIRNTEGEVEGVSVAGVAQKIKITPLDEHTIEVESGEAIWQENIWTKEIQVINPPEDLTFLTVDVFGNIASAIVLEPRATRPSWIVLNLTDGRYYKIPLPSDHYASNALTELTGENGTETPTRAYAVVRNMKGGQSIMGFSFRHPFGAFKVINENKPMDPSDLRELSLSDGENSVNLVAASRNLDGSASLITVSLLPDGTILNVTSVDGLNKIRSPVFGDFTDSLASAGSQILPHIPWSKEPLDNFNPAWMRNLH